MGMNPRYALWSDENWQGYAPTVGHMQDRRWSLTAKCQTCELEINVSLPSMVRRNGRDWSPWGVESRCPRTRCIGRMRFRARNGLAAREIHL